MKKADRLLQFSMSPTIMVRMSALTLFISLIAGVVVMATAGQGVTCRREIPGELIRELWNRTNALINELPKEERFSRRLRLLPKFCTKCSERSIGWLELQKIIDIYQASVFSRAAIKKFLPQHYDELLYRLHHTLQHCVSSSKHSKYSKTIKKTARKIKKRRDEGALKAVREFSFILRWIDELM
ncbi:hypothetical protein ATANTOWER_005385 [Ataeniobius toweri]|uniref:Interleukin-26 n=1 Tax=Ataeniobius toweri TaxID=208326 RepID=A0ABU7BWX0_9TELE|nr:hypothetical protein [Ataeniobius toweri]